LDFFNLRPMCGSRRRESRTLRNDFSGENFFFQIWKLRANPVFCSNSGLQGEDPPLKWRKTMRFLLDFFNLRPRCGSRRRESRTLRNDFSGEKFFFQIWKLRANPVFCSNSGLQGEDPPLKWRKTMRFLLDFFNLRPRCSSRYLTLMDTPPYKTHRNFCEGFVRSIHNIWRADSREEYIAFLT
jgi:hypothetical protein